MKKYPSLKHWILDEEHHLVEVDLMTWAYWIEKRENCIVEQTTVSPHIWVSTVFLGIDHNFGGEGPPVLFETMLFVGDEGEDCWRYSSWDDAVTGHAMAVKKARVMQKTWEPSPSGSSSPTSSGSSSC